MSSHRRTPDLTGYHRAHFTRRSYENLHPSHADPAKCYCSTCSVYVGKAETHLDAAGYPRCDKCNTRVRGALKWESVTVG
jgi:NAD-dependent SIR2 family protein deacetylase